MLDYLEEGLPILDHERATKTVCTYSDACDTGMAGLICGIGLMWVCDISDSRCELAKWHIGGTEAIALLETVRRVCAGKAPHDRLMILAWVDNQGLAAGVNRKRAAGAKSEMDFLIQTIWNIVRYHKCWIHCFWLSSKSNRVADSGSRIWEDTTSAKGPSSTWRTKMITEVRVRGRSWQFECRYLHHGSPRGISFFHAHFALAQYPLPWFKKPVVPPPRARGRIPNMPGIGYRR